MSNATFRFSPVFFARIMALLFAVAGGARALAAFDVDVVAPSNVQAVALSTSEVRVTWTAGTETALEIFVARVGEEFVLAGSASPGGRVFVAHSLDSNTEYRFRVVGQTYTRGGRVNSPGTNEPSVRTRALVATDVGAVATAGSTTQSRALVTVVGSGAGIWGAADEFQFAHQPWSGDGTLIVRVPSVQNTHAEAKVGIMFRENLSAGARHVLASVSPNGTAALVSRAVTGGDSDQKAGTAGSLPRWLKLIRTGSSFEAYQSADGIAWSQIGAVEINLPADVLAGIAVTSSADGVLCTATVERFNISQTFNPGTPASPTDLQSIVVSAARTEHRWNDPAGATSIEVQRSTDNVNFMSLGSVALGAQLFIDTAASPGTTYYYRARGRNANGPSLFSNVTTLTTPSLSATSTAVAQHPATRSAAVGESVTFTAAATNSNSTYQWQWNGANIPGATSSTYTVSSVGPANTGVYSAVITEGNVASVSNPASLGVMTTQKITGSGSEVGANIAHPNGNAYDQILLQGTSATVTADPGQVVRISFIDLGDDIVQVEFSGAGTLSLTLGNASGPAAPVKYNQPGVAYMKGHASIVISGANESTHVSVFSVGRTNAVNQSLFREGQYYEGTASLAYIAISSTNGKFGSIRAANAVFFEAKGITGIHAPGVQIMGPVYLHDINAGLAAIPVLQFGSASDVRITGGDMWQPNTQPVRVSGIAQLRFTDGTTSHGLLLPKQENKAVYDENGGDVTARLMSTM